MGNYADQAISAVYDGKMSFCKFLSANDTGLTGGHQAGIYISKSAVPILFDERFERGTNQEKWVKIAWQDGRETDTRFIYYGRGTRNEYRITNFGRGFEFLRSEYTGALFFLVKDEDYYYRGFILDTDDEINKFLEAFNISPTETNNIINTQNHNLALTEKQEFYNFIATLNVDFPSSEVMSAKAREIENTIYNHREYIISNPDKKLLSWTDIEFKLFRALEHARYGEVIRNGFNDVEDFINIANQVLNRRKSRAGKSLEHHLTAIFDENRLKYTAQAVTEGNKKPDFLFPSQEAYHDLNFGADKLISLAAKATCKDRWRQIINEANRLRKQNKFLCTLQQGVSAAQMDEMQAEKVVLVVPSLYIKTYPKEKQDCIWSVKKFIDYVKEVENIR